MGEVSNVRIKHCPCWSQDCCSQCYRSGFFFNFLIFFIFIFFYLFMRDDPTVLISLCTWIQYFIKLFGKEIQNIRQRWERNVGETFRHLRGFFSLRFEVQVWAHLYLKSQTQETPERAKRLSNIPFPSLSDVLKQVFSSSERKGN